MAVVSLLLLAILPIFIIFYEISRRKRYASMPPGPSPLPLLGNITEFLGSDQPKHEKLAKMSEMYGDVMTVWMMTQPVVVLSSVEAVRKAYIEKQHDFASRPDSLISSLFFGGYDIDVIFGRYTPRWVMKRKLLHGSIRQLVGTEHLERESSTAINQVIDKMLRERSDLPIDLRHFLVQSVYNNVMILVFGKRFDLDDPEFLKFCEFHNVDDEAIAATRIYDMLPFLTLFLVALISPTVRKMKRLVSMYRGYLKKWFNETEDHEGEIEYMTQALKKGLDAVASKENGKSDENGAKSSQPFSEVEISAMLFDLFIAATSTSSSALSWLFLELTRNPDIQERCYNEILQVVGLNRTVSLSDRPNLPYIEACIFETLRFHSPVSLNAPHVPPADTVLGDYTIPAGTQTIMNIWALHHDPKLWKDAHNFNPDNFLDSNGQVNRPPQMMPFGAGRRVCVGEAFAKSGIFLTMTSMLQRLQFDRVDGCDYSIQAEINGEFVNVPKPYRVHIRER